MDLASWHEALLFLWITPHVLLAVLAVILLKRRLYREFPCFLAYVLCEIAGFALRFALYSVLGVKSNAYAYAFSATLLVSIALRFGVISEVARDLFRESQFLKTVARRSLLGLTALLAAVAILLAVYAPGNNAVRWHTGISVINKGAAFIQCALVLFFLFFSRFLGLSWRRPAFGIALGLGILTSVDLAMFALRAELSSKTAAASLDLLRTGSYLVCVSIWIWYLLTSETEPPSPPGVSLDEVETCNKEVRQWLKD